MHPRLLSLLSDHAISMDATPWFAWSSIHPQRPIELYSSDLNFTLADMTSPKNQAAWLHKANAPLEVGDAPMPTVGPGEIVVKNVAVAINPLDCHMQDVGVFVQQWPACFGCDVAGEVFDVGAEVKKFKKGDRVIGCVALGQNILMRTILTFAGTALISQPATLETAPINSIPLYRPPKLPFCPARSLSPMAS